MKLDTTGINNLNEYFTNHYFSSTFSEDASDIISRLKQKAADQNEKAPWKALTDCLQQYSAIHERFIRVRTDAQVLQDLQTLADLYLQAFDYGMAASRIFQTDDGQMIPVYHEVRKYNGSPLLWVMLAAAIDDKDAGVLQSRIYNPADVKDTSTVADLRRITTRINNEDLANQILFTLNEPPRFLIFIGMNAIAFIDRNKWGEKRYIEFDLEEIFGRRQQTTFEAMSVLLDKECLCPVEGKPIIDTLNEQSERNASGVSTDLKYALRESIELLGNEVIYYRTNKLNHSLEEYPVDAAELTLECVRYMYRMLFVLFIEARPELGFAPMKSQVYFQGYSLESLREIAEHTREDIEEVGDGYYLHETLSKLYDLIYDGYPFTDKELKELNEQESVHDVFSVPPLKAHIFDPERTKMLNEIKIRNKTMLRILDLMSLTRGNGKSGSRGRISYSNLGINQMGSVYEALLSYNGFIASQDLYEVKKADENFVNELDVGYFVPENQLEQYTEDERVYTHTEDHKKKLRMYPKGTFIYRLAGREREKSASYYTPEVLTKCLVKYALKELLKDKTADEILNLTVCEPAMGSASFLNEAINQLAEAYLDKKQKELKQTISYEDRPRELQKVKMYIADRNVYGIDLNPVAVELAEVSLWLNTIYEGGFVPWFGTQLVNGNSLIGARRQCYTVGQLTTKSKGAHWYEMAPERVPLGTERKKKTVNKNNRQIYHFLTGDPGMCNYTDKVIKQLEPENIKTMNAWRKEFTKPYSNDDIDSMLRLSELIDELWDKQVALREEVDKRTKDQLSVFGHKDTVEDSHTSIREKDKIFSELYKTEHAMNAGPYARLKFAMDYWCSLWFWPIDKADLLPTRSMFFVEMSLILIGTVNAAGGLNGRFVYQPSLFQTEKEKEAMQAFESYDVDGIVNIDDLCNKNPRLALVREIAGQNHFMHWELEFADLFKHRDGFDLVVGNPPWIKITWEEKDVLSESNPLFAIRKLSAADIQEYREEAFINKSVEENYQNEYTSLSAQQNYLNSDGNYDSLKGLQGNLYEAFLPQSWTFTREYGVFALIHPESVFTDSKGINIRRELNQRLRKHYKFGNALKLFQDVHPSREFGLNVYSNERKYEFEQIVKLYAVNTIEECYEDSDKNPPQIRDNNGNINLRGQRSRIINIGVPELKLFARVLDQSDNWRSARLMSVYSQEILNILECFDKQKYHIIDLNDDFFASQMWDETNAQKDGTIKRNVHFGKENDSIFSGTHIGTGNPLFNCSNKNCKGNNDNTSIDLENIPEDYIPRTNYSPASNRAEYEKRIPRTQWGASYSSLYRICARKMMDVDGERTLMAALMPPFFGHTNGIIGFAFQSPKTMALLAGGFISLPFDLFIKICEKGNLYINVAGALPLLNPDSPYANEIICRALRLNCLTHFYSMLWSNLFAEEYRNIKWASSDKRLEADSYKKLTASWTYATPIRKAYSRRQAMLEIDVLVAMDLGMTLDELISAYRIQFPILQQHERDTFYDNNGRIVYAKNNALTNVGFDRITWENKIKGAPAGKKFYRTITDDTMPGGPVERTIEYVAPFDRCDRIEDYKTAWKFFEEKYKDQK